MSDDIGKSVRDKLKHTTQVTAYVGQRIYADVLEQATLLPAVVVFVPNSQCHEDINTSNRCLEATVEVIAWGKDRDQVNAIAKAIRDYALPADARGSIEGMDWTDCSLVAGPAEMVDPPDDGSDRWRKITKQTFVIWAAAV